MSLSDDINSRYGDPNCTTAAFTVNVTARAADIATKLAPYLSSRHLLFRRHGIDHALWMLDHETGDLTEMRADAFNPWLCQYVNLVQGEEKIPCDMPSQTARSVMAAPQLQRRLPCLRSVNSVRLPFFEDEENGVVGLLPTGWHEPTQTFTINNDLAFEHNLAMKDGITYLVDLLKTFPFAREGAPDGEMPRSMWTMFNAMLTVFCCNLFPWGSNSPLFLFNANMPGGGKSILVKLCLYPVYGEASDTRFVAKSEWFDKELDAHARNSSPYLFMDNVSGFVESDSLEAWLTQPSRCFRKMASHDQHKNLLRCVSFLTGNNLRMKADIYRRCEFVVLESEGTAFERRLRRESGVEIDDKFLGAPSNRARILAALWSIVRDWSENYETRKIFDKSSYTAWAAIIPSMTHHALGGDPLRPAKMKHAGDVYEDDLNALVGSLVKEVMRKRAYLPPQGNHEEAVPGMRFRVGEIAAMCRKEGLYENILADIDTVTKEKERMGKIGAVRIDDDTLLQPHELTLEQKHAQCWDYLTQAMGIKLGQLLAKADHRKFTVPISVSNVEYWRLTPAARDSLGKTYELRFDGREELEELVAPT